MHRRVRVALAASLLLHALLALLFFTLRPLVRLHVKPPLETVTIRQTLTIERKRVMTPRPVAAAQRRAPRATIARVPRPKAVVLKTPPVAFVRTPPREIAKIVPRALPHPPRAVAWVPKASVGKAVTTGSQFTGQQLARIQADLSAGIARDRAGIDPLRVAPGTTEQIKHYAPDVNGLATQRYASGLCDPIKSWTEDGWNYYYVACNVRFSDGTYQRQGVPWPMRFNPGDDPFDGTARDRNRPIAMPLPGWHLGAGQTVSPELREYARARGVEITPAASP